MNVPIPYNSVLKKQKQNKQTNQKTDTIIWLQNQVIFTPEKLEYEKGFFGF